MFLLAVASVALPFAVVFAYASAAFPDLIRDRAIWVARAGLLTTLGLAIALPVAVHGSPSLSNGCPNQSHQAWTLVKVLALALAATGAAAGFAATEHRRRRALVVAASAVAIAMIAETFMLATGLCDTS